MNLEARIEGFSLLGRYIREYIEAQSDDSSFYVNQGQTALSILEQALLMAGIENPWFTRDNIIAALRHISISMNKPGIEIFTKP